MLYVFSTNRVKLVARKPKTTDNMGQREYLFTLKLAFIVSPNDKPASYTRFWIEDLKRRPL